MTSWFDHLSQTLRRGTLPRAADRIASVVIWLLVSVSFVILIGFSVRFGAAAVTKRPTPLPVSMDAVDWHDPASSRYCLACHRQVGVAAGGIEVQRGHAQNVALNEEQLSAVARMGTVAGPGDTLICMSCHVLDGERTVRFMLADTLEDSRLCQRCHPDHDVRDTPHDLRLTAPLERNKCGQTVAMAGPCSACHLAHGVPRKIERSPRDPDGRCITCHSSHGVAAAHTRAVMDHPEAHCGECHNPHDMTHGSFLDDEIDALCIRCHEGYNAGTGGGMHPLGSMEFAIPAELVARAHPLGNDHRLTCVICHDTHVAEHRSLLHLPLESNELCLACHADKLAAGTDTGVLPRHGQQPPLNADQQSVVASWKGQVSGSGGLLCISCHHVHGGEAGTDLLAFRPDYGQSCLACHPEQERLLRTAHDLRCDFPDLENISGATTLEAGPCSACHLAHQFARERVRTVADPGGQCITCHRSGQCAGGASPSGIQHPETACSACHEPHDPGYAAFLRAPEAELCAGCHPSQDRLTGGPHDFTANPTAWPDDTANGRCLPCHVPHGGERADLLRVRFSPVVGNHDDVCLACHPAAGWDADSGVAALHPREIPDDVTGVGLALVPVDDGGRQRIGCRTCHDPHGAAEPAYLARVGPQETTAQLCLHCHDEKRLIRLTGHAPAALAEAGFDSDSCRPCHAMHASPENVYGTTLSPRFLEQYFDSVEPSVSEGHDDALCVVCHRDEGPAPVRRFTRHPRVATFNFLAPDAPGYMPTFGPDGKVDVRGQITCRTCHISHGRLDLLRRVEAATDEASAELQRNAIRMQIRHYQPPNLCSTCHDRDGRRLFLFFHEPPRRPPDAATPMIPDRR